MTLLKISFFLFIVVLCPILIFILILGSTLYNFRESLKIEPIPQRGYRSRIRDLNGDLPVLETLEFEKIDEFYLKTIPNIITYVFKHKNDPIYLCQYHLGQKMASDYITRYRDEITLTTANTVDAGMTPRPDKNLLQIFPGRSFGDLLLEHQKSHQFLTENFTKAYDIPESEFRHYFMKSFHEQGAYMRKPLLWPFVLLVRTVTKYGKIYCKSVIDQLSDGRLKIYS
jgi:hypothetical protein